MLTKGKQKQQLDAQALAIPGIDYMLHAQAQLTLPTVHTTGIARPHQMMRDDGLQRLVIARSW